MSGMNELDDSSKLLEDIGSLESAITRLEASFKKLTESASSFTTSMRGGMGSGPASASTAGTGGVGASGPNFLNQGLASVAPFMKMNAIKSAGFSILGGAVQAIGGLAAGAFSAMPNVDAAMGMASGEYYQGYMSGNNWRTVGSSTANFLGNGQNMVGAAGVVSASLASQGITFNGTKNNSGVFGGAGMYGSIAKSIGGAAQMMNVSNDVAAQSIGSMYSGATSMGLMQNFGIMTTNPNSGKSATPTQIFAMLNDRLTGGGRMSYKQVQTALGPGGALSLDIQNSGLDATGQQMLRSYMLSASQGKYLNFDNPNSAASQSAIKAAGGNPLQAGMTVTAATNQTMQTAATAYVDGMNKATKAIVGLEHTLNNFLKSPFGKMFAEATGAMNLAGKSTAVTGLATAATGVLGGAATAISGVAGAAGTFKLLKKLGIGGGGAGTAFKDATAMEKFMGNAGGLKNTVGRTFGKTLGKSMGWLGALMEIPTLIGDVASGNFKKASSDVGGAVGSLGGGSLGSTIGAGLGALIPVLGETGIGELLGGWAGGAIGSMLGGGAGNAVGGAVGNSLGLSGQGGTKSTITATGLTDTTKQLSLVSPCKGPITTKYGQTTDAHGTALWGGKPHLAIDYGVPVGTVVQAAASGTVIETGSGSGSMSYGNYIILDHGNGYTTLYAHLSQIGVTKGDSVAQGQQIGVSGATGYVTGPHLHFETRKNGQPINPANLGLGPAVAVVAGNTNQQAGSNSDGSIGGGAGLAGGAGTLGLNSGAGNAGFISPSSYGGAAIGGAQVASSSYKPVGTAAASMQNGTGKGSGTTGGQGGPGLRTGKTPPNVQINVTVAQASESEARRLAQMVKDYLEEDKLTHSMGRM